MSKRVYRINEGDSPFAKINKTPKINSNKLNAINEDILKQKILEYLVLDNNINFLDTIYDTIKRGDTEFALSPVISIILREEYNMDYDPNDQDIIDLVKRCISISKKNDTYIIDIAVTNQKNEMTYDIDNNILITIYSNLERKLSEITNSKCKLILTPIDRNEMSYILNSNRIFGTNLIDIVLYLQAYNGCSVDEILFLIKRLRLSNNQMTSNIYYLNGSTAALKSELLKNDINDLHVVLDEEATEILEDHFSLESIFALFTLKH